MNSRPEHKKRQKAFRSGIWSERLAAFSLRLKGYRILERNFRVKSGEIDIIASKGDLIAIVEVKSRKTLNQAIDAVGFENQNRVRAATDWWLSKQQNAHMLSVRFDIISVQPLRWPVHLKDAF